MAKQPHLLVEDGELNETALVPGDPGRVDRIADRCDDATVMAENREYRSVNATYAGTELSIVSTGIGCPSAAIAVEELANVGVERVIRVGTCGALQREIAVGDMIVATGAAKEEGTSKRYESATYPAVPDYTTLDALVAAAEASESATASGLATATDGGHDADATDTSADGGTDATGAVHVGPLVSDDAFYNETDEYVADWEAANLLAIEMEAAAIFSLARRRGLAAGAICTVDGNLVAGTQKGADSDEELPDAAKDNVARAIDIALDATSRLAD